MFISVRGASPGLPVGALGVLQLAVAAAWLPSSGEQSGGALITCGDDEDGYASVRLDPAGDRVPAGAS
nr:hypothetical protein OH820_33705 [Streptomyces sp. NBC_00857]